MKRKTHYLKAGKAVMAVCCLVMAAGFQQSCKDDDDVLEGQPDFLGNSIYERLQDAGTYTTLLRLIDDVEDNKEVLSRTGSRTLFAADDDAYQKWFASTAWTTGSGEPVRSYEQLSDVQKKVLLNTCMLNNAYLLELMSSVSASTPIVGEAMRRDSKYNIYDSVPLMQPADMPDTKYWSDLKAEGNPIRILKDNTRAPLIHFLPAFMQKNGFTVEDLSLLTNKEGQSLEESWINGAKVIESDITCKNGYIQKVDRVLEASPNMAEILHQHPEQLSTWTSLIDRFCAPYPRVASQTKDADDATETQLQKYQRLYSLPSTSKLYTLKYFSSQSLGAAMGKMQTTDPNDSTTDAQLSFDPGWNQYIYTNTSGEDLHYDAGAMLVPTNDAITQWWNNEGADLQEEYGTVYNVPMKTISKLLNVNMLPNFVETIPSKFDNILNDAKEQLGVTKDNIVGCYMGCNGVVYVLDKVFTPAEFSSVVYPALAHPSRFSIIYDGIEDQNYLPYLLAMDQQYTMILPTDTAMKYGYLDPVFYNTDQPQLMSFKWNELLKTIKAERRRVTIEDDGTLTISNRILDEDVDADIINNRMKDIVNNFIILGNIKTTNYEYYKTKAGSYIRVDRSGPHLRVQGAWQRDHDVYLDVDNEDQQIVYKTNGISLLLDQGMPMTAEKSVYKVLYDRRNDEFKEFYALFNGGGTSSLMKSTDNGRLPAGGSSNNKNVSLFNNYNYTVYVPTNEAVKELQNEGYLPTWSDVNKQTQALWRTYGFKGTDAKLMADSAKAILQDIILDFVRYHIQDNSLMIGAEPVHTDYESMMRNPETDRFFGINANLTSTDLTLTNANGTQTISVDKSNGLYNIQCREYWFKNATNSTDDNKKTIYFVSDAVVHHIDGVLLPNGKAGMKKWQDIIEELKAAASN